MRVGDKDGAGSGGKPGKIALLACRWQNEKVTNKIGPPWAGDGNLVRTVLAMDQREYSD